MAMKALLLAAVLAVVSGTKLEVNVGFTPEIAAQLRTVNQSFVIVREGAYDGAKATVWARYGIINSYYNTLSWNDSVQVMWVAQQDTLKVGDKVMLGYSMKEPVYTGTTYPWNGLFAKPVHLPDYPVTYEQYGLLNNWTIPRSFGLAQSVAFDVFGSAPKSQPILNFNLLPHEHATIGVPSNNFYIFLASRTDARVDVGTVVDIKSLKNIANSPVSFIAFDASEKSINVAFRPDTYSFQKGSLPPSRKQ